MQSFGNGGGRKDKNPGGCKDSRALLEEAPLCRCPQPANPICITSGSLEALTLSRNRSRTLARVAALTAGPNLPRGCEGQGGQGQVAAGSVPVHIFLQNYSPCYWAAHSAQSGFWILSSLLVLERWIPGMEFRGSDRLAESICFS